MKEYRVPETRVRDFATIPDKNWSLVPLRVYSQIRLRARSDLNELPNTRTFTSLRSGIPSATTIGQMNSASGPALTDAHNPAVNPKNEDTGINIVSPIPLPYTARSKAVLRSMISFPPTSTTSSVMPRVFSAQYLPPGSKRSKSKFSAPSSVLAAESSHLAGASITQQIPEEDTKLGSRNAAHIRQVTASTLMALTEPFLLAWCLESDAGIDNPASACAVTESRPDAQYLIQSSYPVRFGETHTLDKRNSWGY